jgi:surfactin synthase thioesterase subunit
VCFAHAGGSASYFHPVSAALSPSIDVLALQYPGRQDRRSEPLIDDLHVLADHIAGALVPWTDRPVSFFGHSMGATLAYETALRLESQCIKLETLFVSGRRSPTIFRVETVHQREDANLIAEVQGLSGTESQLLEDEEIVRMILPALRNDYRAAETYRYRPSPQLSCRLVALIGDNDPKVTPSEADDWKRHTAGEFELRVFSGGHFYLNDNMQEVLDLVANAAK